MAIIYKDKQQIVIEIKKLMLDNRITQKEVANKLGIKPQALTKLFAKKNFGFEDVNHVLDTMGYELVIDFKEKNRLRSDTTNK